MKSWGKIFKITFLLIFLTELLSLSGYLIPDINTIVFYIIILLTIILSLYKLEYGLWILLVELFIGSKGYLFFFEYSGLSISIRIALWLVVMSVWLTNTISHLIKTKKIKIRFFNSQFFSYFIILFFFIFWGLINGFLNKNIYSNIFFDFNGWLYFLLIFPIYDVLNKTNSIKKLIQIFAAAILWLSFKTISLLFIFSHNLSVITETLYRWVRVTGVGEITQLQGGFYRIFFQSHIFILIVFFFFLLIIVDKKNSKYYKDRKYNTILFAIMSMLFTVVLISFSRSFWVGMLAGFLILSIYIIVLYKWKNLIRYVGVILLSFALSVSFIALVVKFPYPKPIGGFVTTELLTERVSTLTGEAAISSRWALLPKLMDKIKQTPIRGSGFGTTVTFKSSDPRVISFNPAGQYTTFAFEWGWLDIWLKLGIFGLISYVLLLIKIYYSGLKSKLIISLEEKKQSNPIDYSIIKALIIGIFIIAVVNFFSPYLNHPLGIGYILLVSAIIEVSYM